MALYQPFHRTGFDAQGRPIIEKGHKRSSRARWLLADAILSSKANIVALQEPESLEAVDNFNRTLLGGKFRVFCAPSRDPRGQVIAFLIDASLPFDWEVSDLRDERWPDPSTGREEFLFPKGLLTLSAISRETREPVFAIAGLHLKSKNDRPNDKLSTRWRTEQVRRMVKLLTPWLKRPFALVGDFNGLLHEEDCFAELFSTLGLKDTLDIVEYEKSRGTHTHFSKGVAIEQQIDAILVGGGWQGNVTGSEIISYPAGIWPPSDHKPVFAEIVF